jgi:hypothetical protein
MQEPFHMAGLSVATRPRLVRALPPKDPEC